MLGTQVILNTTFQRQIARKKNQTIQTLQDILSSSVTDFKGTWVYHWSLIEFSYNKSYLSNIKIANLEDLYGRKCKSLF